jgi:hypothetical protein
MPLSSREFAAIERPVTNSRIFAHTRWDAIPVAAALLHCVYFFAMSYLFPRVPLWVMLILGFMYSVSISWNINGISHNFIHMQHHKGNADRPDEHGETIDWISIYKHGHDGEAEHPLKYTFLTKSNNLVTDHSIINPPKLA